jgi:DNA modification methylase
VLDPFGGAGTAGLVAKQQGRDAILFELNPANADLARERIEIASATPLRRKALLGSKIAPAELSNQIAIFS